MSIESLSTLQHRSATPSGARASDSVGRETFLKAMRQVASSVAIVTTAGQAGRHGATVTAFCSVSADPPTLLICLRTDSRISRAVEANAVFTLNVLPASAEETARAFAGEFDKVRTDRFEGRALIERDGLAPAIDGALGFFCRLVRFDRQDSHTIFFGRIREIVHGTPDPLTYIDGNYGSVCRFQNGDEAGLNSCIIPFPQVSQIR